MHANNSFDQEIKIASKFVGKRPNIVAEKGLINRVKSKGFGKYIRTFPELKAEEFYERLAMSEKATRENIKFKGDWTKLKQASVRVFNACKFPSKLFRPISGIQAVYKGLNHSSSSGFPKSIRKGRILDEIYSETIKVLADPFKFLNIWNFPTYQGFRIQLRESEGEIKRKTRVMYPYPAIITVMELLFVAPFVEHFKIVDSFYVIGRNGGQISRLLKRKLARSKKIYGSDFSSFDQRLLNAVIICAFGVLRSQLQLNPTQQFLFENVCTYCCTSLIVSYNGKPYSYIKDHGMPSGSCFTNLIDTIAHAIMLEYCIENVIDRCLLCGDDIIADFSGIDHTNLVSQLETIFNMIIKPEDLVIYKDSHKVYFLGFIWTNYVRNVSPLLVINQLIYHSDWISFELMTPYEREVSRAVSILFNGANGLYLFKRLFDDVYGMIKNGIDVKYNYLPSARPWKGNEVRNEPYSYAPNESISSLFDNGWTRR
jgi:hypothetical protein